MNRQRFVGCPHAFLRVWGLLYFAPMHQSMRLQTFVTLRLVLRAVVCFAIGFLAGLTLG